MINSFILEREDFKKENNHGDLTIPLNTIFQCIFPVIKLKVCINSYTNSVNYFTNSVIFFTNSVNSFTNSVIVTEIHQVNMKSKH